MDSYELRIISGSHRGRKLRLPASPHVRPMTDRVRAALFSILGDAVPERAFFDVFAGTGAVGLEALSRGASRACFIEKDNRNTQSLQRLLREWQLADRAQVLQADAYRWADKGALPAEPCNVFLGPPYPELDAHLEALQGLLRTLEARLATGSVLAVQTEKQFPEELLCAGTDWDTRLYGRTRLSIWVKKASAAEVTAVPHEHEPA
ncbi:MAG TPA: RsmD family RNA methyltransferase [Gemmatales bacterium]|nr:RsmD family RNA methyltransferase [Gemmatales bacterium]HMP58129.1 RsmD family RNA methyltransferase [Gemmatales bacterium]